MRVLIIRLFILFGLLFPALAAAVDTSPPTVPGNFYTNIAGTSQVNVGWLASTDNVGVTAYKVYRNGALIKTVTAPATTWSDTSVAANTVYKYTIQACDAAANCSAQTLPAVVLTVPQTGPNYAYVRIYRSQNQGGTNDGFSFNLGYLRYPNDGLSSYSISCPGIAPVTGNFTAAPASGSTWEWHNSPYWNLTWNLTPPATPMTCTSTVTLSNSTQNSAPVNIDTFLPASAYAQNISLGYFQNVSAVPSVSWTPAAGYIYQSSVAPIAGGAFLWSSYPAQPPVAYAGSALAANSTYLYYVYSIDAIGGNYIHETFIAIPFCYQCSGDSTAPSVPVWLRVNVTSSTQLNPFWAASTDNTGVAYYKVYRNGTLVYEPRSYVTDFTDSGLTPGATYTYTVAACDAQNNCSAQTAPTSMTLPLPGAYPSMSSLSFPNTPQGASSAAQTVILSNDGAAALTVGAVNVTGDFKVTGNTCNVPVDANGGKCRISVSFAPSATGIRSGSLSIASGAANSPNSVSLTGTGAPAAPLAGNLWTRLGIPSHGSYGFTTTQDGSYWADVGYAGLYLSQDGGATWQPRNNGLGSLRINTFLFNYDPAMAATGSAIATNLYEVYAPTMGGGVYRSLDGGNTWSATNNGLNCRYAGTIARVADYSPAALYAGTSCKQNSGVYYSMDDGASWTLASGMPPDVWVNSITRIAPPTGTALPDFILATTNKGIFKSTDQGVNWALTDSSISTWGSNGHVAYGVTSAYYSASSTQVVLTRVDGVGVFRSTNQGTTWSQVTAGLPAGGMPLSLSSDGGGNLYAVIDGYGIYKSAASSMGTSWVIFADNTVLPNATYISQKADQSNNGALTYFAGTSSGTYKSTDGLSWIKLITGTGFPAGSSSSVGMDNAGNTYVAAGGGVYKYNMATQTAALIGGNSPGIGRMIINGAGTIYAGTNNLGVFLYDSVNDRWIPKNTGLPANLAAQNPSLRYDPSNTGGSGIWAGLYGQGVYYTANGGATWAARNGNLTGDALKVRSLQTSADGVTVLISTEAGIWRSGDSGATWSQVFVPATASGAATSVNSIAIDNGTTSFSAYVAVYNTDALGMPYASNGVWKSSDGGVTWSQLGGLAGKKVDWVRVARPGGNLVLYAGVWDGDGTGGIYQSTDGGSYWVSISSGLGNIYSNSILIDGAGNPRYLATLGDGVYAYNSGVPVPTVTPNFTVGWNLVGNSINAPLDVAATLGDTTKVTTVWKWIPATRKWAFYAPSMTPTNLSTYAAGKGYDVLTTINSGEGFWVNAKAGFTAQLPAGAVIGSSTFTDKAVPPNNLPAGWSLIAVGDSPSPRNFANTIAISQPVSPAVAAASLTTLWAWDSGLSGWYFYAPSLDNAGTLASYITSKNYLNFGAKTLDPAMGFWVNHP